MFHWPACKCPKDDRLWNLGAKSEKVYQTWERHQLKQQSKVEAIDQPYQLEVPSELHQAWESYINPIAWLHPFPIVHTFLAKPIVSNSSYMFIPSTQSDPKFSTVARCQATVAGCSCLPPPSRDAENCPSGSAAGLGPLRTGDWADGRCWGSSDHRNRCGSCGPRSLGQWICWLHSWKRMEKRWKGNINHVTMWELCNILGFNESLCQFNPVYTWSIRSIPLKFLIGGFMGTP